MAGRKVVVLALHDEMESAYPPLNIAVGAASSGAEVILAFSGKGVNILDRRYVPVPSRDIEYLSGALEKFGVATVHEMLGLAVELGVELYAVDIEKEGTIDFLYPAEQVPTKWILNEAAAADLFMHF
ncbi:peroxiredoxin family protein [Bacillus sp. REN3]|uniref:peroxiredoxin family protein n=1 Tax=Bacillus sp. REN3 TaxID=2802440 RepID=UPI001AEE831B|nr:peroxiredoxin family protein [Bacillus sp. REN3]